MKFLLMTLMLLFFDTIDAQELKTHVWKNRIMVFVSNNKETIETNDLITEIETDTSGLNERKLIIYKVLPKNYEVGEEIIDSNKLYNALNPEKNDFKFILIGLDGRIKVEKSEPLSKKELFTIIDAMPMRASELKNE